MATNQVIESLRSALDVPRFLKPFFLVVAGLEMAIVFGVACTYLLLQPLIPLMYTLPERADQLVPKIWIWLFPVLGAISVIITRLGITLLRHDEPSLQKLYVVAHITLLGLLFLAYIRIMMLVLL